MTEVYLNLMASAVCSKIVRNDAASLGQPAHDCERIAQKTAIRNRRVASEHEFTSDVASRATQILLQRGAKFTDAIDSLIVCSQSPVHLIPGVSLLVVPEAIQNTSMSVGFGVGLSWGVAPFDYVGQMQHSQPEPGSDVS